MNIHFLIIATIILGHSLAAHAAFAPCDQTVRTLQAHARTIVSPSDLHIHIRHKPALYGICYFCGKKMVHKDLRAHKLIDGRSMFGCAAAHFFHCACLCPNEQLKTAKCPICEATKSPERAKKEVLFKRVLELKECETKSTTSETATDDSGYDADNTDDENSEIGTQSSQQTVAEALEELEMTEMPE